ncbi:MAG: hypothetical protein MZV64_17480 [Ignavibacteriales bacterium]|nr:hypothetical protein [Ignavibacteriales bacterium]
MLGNDIKITLTRAERTYVHDHIPSKPYSSCLTWTFPYTLVHCRACYDPGRNYFRIHPSLPMEERAHGKQKHIAAGTGTAFADMQDGLLILDHRDSIG